MTTIKLFKSDVRDSLLSFLDENAPRTVFFLHRLWKEQENAITYKELREALLSGEINKEWFRQWQQDYSQFVAEHLEPDWRKAIQEAARRQEENFSGWRFDPASEGINSWVAQRGAAFVTNSTDTQIKALRAAVHHIAGTSQNVDELARLVRPMIGLTKPQTIANANYVKKLQEKNLPPKKVADLAAKHAARQHRYRAQMIARTELAFTFNQGTLEWARQAQAAGYLGKAVRVWISTRDERCCDVCRKLNDDKTEVPLDEPFPFQTRLSDPDARLAPPAHPMCRYAIDIREIESPPEPDFDEIEEISTLPESERYDIIEEIPEPKTPQSSGRIEPSESTGDTLEPGKVTQIGTIDFSDKQAVLEQLAKAQTDFADLDYEMNRTVTTDGKVWEVSGTSGEVNPWGIEAYGSSLKGSYSYHNHPAKGTWYSFSDADVRFFLHSDSVFSKASDDIYEYTMERTKDTFNIDPETAYHRFSEILNTSVLEKAFNSEIDFDKDGYHETMIQLSREYKFKYLRKKLR